MKKLVLICVGVVMGLSALAQPGNDDYVQPSNSPNEEKEWEAFKKLTPRERTVVGGNFSFLVGTSSYIFLEPQLGYRLTNRLSAGASAGYMYFGNRSYSESIYMGSGWARLGIINGLFACAEYSMVNRQSFYQANLRETFPIFLVGGGISQGSKYGIGYSFQILYDLSEDERSPYGPLAFKAGVLIPLNKR
jgi:hypothetical protein